MTRAKMSKVITSATPRSAALPDRGWQGRSRRRQDAFSLVKYVSMGLSLIAVHSQIARIDHDGGIHHLVRASVKRIPKRVGRIQIGNCSPNEGCTNRAHKLKIAAIARRSRR